MPFRSDFLPSTQLLGKCIGAARNLQEQSGPAINASGTSRDDHCVSISAAANALARDLEEHASPA